MEALIRELHDIIENDPSLSSRALDSAEMARRYGPETPVPDWRLRLVCSRCGTHDTDMVVTGTEGR
jgi:hypothetical protein